jgi:hypothetical protein
LGRDWPLYRQAAGGRAIAGTLETSAIFALGNTLEGVAGGFLIQRWSGGRDTFTSPARRSG